MHREEPTKETALDAKVASFDGSNDAYAYAMGSAAWDQIDEKVSIECTFKDNGTFPNGTEHSICSEKEGGGYSIVVYSGKLISGLFGGGLGSMVVDSWGYNGAYALAGGISMVAACIALMLRQPGRPRVRDIVPNPQPVSREVV